MTTPTGQSAAPGDYWPMAVGDRWVYADDIGKVQRELVTGTRTVGGQGALIVQTTELGTGTRSETPYIKSATSVTELPDGSDPVLLQVGSVVQMLQPLQAGQQRVLIDTVVPQGYDLDGDGVADSTSVRADGTVVGFETLTVAAGRFTDAAHLRTVLTLSATGSRSGTRLSLTTTIDEWYAPAVGRLRSTIVTDFQGTRTTSSSDLIAYKVGGRSSDSSTPRVLQISPAEGVRSSELAEVRLSFDRAMNLDSMTNGALRITGPTGPQTLTLTQSANGQVVMARMGTGLREGSYQVSLSTGATDMLGNAVAARDWTLTIDRTLPAVTASVPAAGATDVALGTTVRLQFNNALDASTINTDSVRLYDVLGTRVTAAVSMPDARTVLLTPAAPLSVATSYKVELTGAVTDTAGNRLGSAAEVLRFSTIQGRFATPALLTGVIGNGLAAGDVDGDGRSDLVTIMLGTSFASFNLYRQNASGTFDAARRLDLLPLSILCPVPSMVQLADMDNDGRTDLVFYRAGCGLSVMFQDAAGGFGDATLLSGNVTYLRLVDMNGDGLRDVVATDWMSTTVSVWLQRAGRTWGAEQAVPLEHNGFGDLAVGDLNGDGRLDIAVTSGQVDLSKALGIAYQQADGSFGAPQYRSLTGTGAWTALTIADVDGDGRSDLLVAAPSGNGLWWYRQQADGTLAAFVRIPATDGSVFLQLVDLNRDGRTDILTALDNGNFQVLTRAADGSFSAPRTYTNTGSPTAQHPPVVADLNGDGWPDLASVASSGVSAPILLRNLGAAVPSGLSLSATPISGGSTALNWRQAIRAVLPVTTAP